MKFKNLKIEIEEKVVTVMLNRPEKLNVLTKELLLELQEFLTTLELPTNNVRGLILVGAGSRAFSAGGDIHLMAQLDQSGGEALSHLAQSVCSMIEHLPILVIACVDGFALGGGCELAMSCDFIYATQASRFGQPEVKIGLIPGFGGNIRLVRLIGPARAKELIYTGRQIQAEEAQKMGLVHRIFNTREELLEATKKTFHEMINSSPFAIATAKKTLNQIQGQPTEVALMIEQKAYGSLFDHSEKIEGVQAFLEKRVPRF